MYKASFICKRDGLTIRGTIYRGDEDRKDYVPVIISHGFMSNQMETGPYGEFLGENGFCAFTYDFCGGGPKSTSDGLFQDMTFETEKADLMAVIEFVRTLDYVDFDRLVIAGCSQGGVISGLTASEYPDLIKKLVLFYPAVCIPDDSHTGKMLFFKFDPDNVPDYIKGLGGLTLNGDYVRQAQKMDVIGAIASYKGPVLLMPGMKDKIVDFSYALKLREQSGPNLQFFSLSHAPHGFRGEHQQTAKKRMLYFLQDKEQILDINVKIIGSKLKLKGLHHLVDLYFEADAKSRFFEGRALPGACDHQDRIFLKPVRFCADYVLEGRDFKGQQCKIHIINVNEGNGWEPTLETDSQALSFLNDTKCYALAEPKKGGIRIRIFANRSKKD